MKMGFSGECHVIPTRSDEGARGSPPKPYKSTRLHLAQPPGGAPSPWLRQWCRDDMRGIFGGWVAVSRPPPQNQNRVSDPLKRSRGHQSYRFAGGPWSSFILTQRHKVIALR